MSDLKNRKDKVFMIGPDQARKVNQKFAATVCWKLSAIFCIVNLLVGVVEQHLLEIFHRLIFISAAIICHLLLVYLCSKGANLKGTKSNLLLAGMTLAYSFTFLSLIDDPPGLGLDTTPIMYLITPLAFFLISTFFCLQNEFLFTDAPLMLLFSLNIFALVVLIVIFLLGGAIRQVVGCALSLLLSLAHFLSLKDTLVGTLAIDVHDDDTNLIVLYPYVVLARNVFHTLNLSSHDDLI